MFWKHCQFVLDVLKGSDFSNAAFCLLTSRYYHDHSFKYKITHTGRAKVTDVISLLFLLFILTEIVGGRSFYECFCWHWNAYIL